MKPKFLFLIFSLPAIALTTAGFLPILAQHFTSASYIIDWGNFNITSGKKSSTNYSLTDTVGQNAPGAFNSAGYTVQSGFQYIYNTLIQFSFSVSKLSINLGTLVPGVGSTDTNIITISTPSGHGYQIIASENHPLSLLNGITIPDTRCNSNSCSDTTSGPWTNSNAFGFGFNAIGINSSAVATGVGTSNIFIDSTFFRSFADISHQEPGQTIMTETKPVKNHSARISYKALISAVQSAGFYQNSIIFTAVPNY